MKVPLYEKSRLVREFLLGSTSGVYGWAVTAIRDICQIYSAIF